MPEGKDTLLLSLSLLREFCEVTDAHVDNLPVGFHLAPPVQKYSPLPIVSFV